MHIICISKLTIIGSGNGLSPGWCQAIIWTNTGILLIWTSGTNFNEILIEIQTFSFKKMCFKNVLCEMAVILSQPQCVNVLIISVVTTNFAIVWILINIAVIAPVIMWYVCEKVLHTLCILGIFRRHLSHLPIKLYQRGSPHYLRQRSSFIFQIWIGINIVLLIVSWDQIKYAYRT